MTVIERAKEIAERHASVILSASAIESARQCDKGGALIGKTCKAHRHLQATKGRAKQQGLPFNLTMDDLIIPSHCPALGIPLVQEWGTTREGGRENAPSIDRIIPELGYVKGNVRVISMRANRLKSNATLEELTSLLAWASQAQEESLKEKHGYPTFFAEMPLPSYVASLDWIRANKGTMSQRAMVDKLNELGYTSKGGGKWYLIQLQRTLRKINAES